jgi:hypothetical protein
MKIVINTIPHKDQVYDTCGNWYWDHDGTLQIQVSELGGEMLEVLVGIHELIEALLCRKHNVSGDDVTRFDIKFEKEREEGKHIHGEEPGDDPRSPYRKEHSAAEFAERAAASALGVGWDTYEDAIRDL